MKASKQCPKCDSLRVGYLENVLDSWGPSYPLKPAKMGKVGLNPISATGELEAYICAECGFYETYVKDPGALDFDNIVGFHWLNPPPLEEGPYR